jgi:hypothetical protein
MKEYSGIKEVMLSLRGFIAWIMYIAIVCALIQFNGCNPHTFYEDQPIQITEK